MKLILAVPTYGPTDPQCNRALRAAIMHAGRHGHEWLGDASPDREGFSHARNHVVKTVLEAEDEQPETYKDALVVWCDSDIVLPVDAITTLAHRGFEFITGVYFQRNGDNWPLIAHFNGKSFNWIVQFERNTIMPVDGCGFGIVLTSLKLLRSVSQDPKHPPFQYEKFSEDFDFCLKAKKQGYGLFADTSVCCGHLGDPVPVTIDDFIKKHSDLWEGRNACKIRSIYTPGDLGISANELERQDGQAVSQAALV